jgi:chemotaxis-related protein WspB
MLYLLVQLANDNYALDARHVVEVLPVVDLKHIPHAPFGVAGILNYHGAPVPVLDLAELVLGRLSQVRMNTRIVITRHVDSSAQEHFLALMAEQTTETIRREESDFVPSGVAVSSVPYLGPVIVEANRIVQRIEIEHLLPAHLREELFTELAGVN